MGAAGYEPESEPSIIERYLYESLLPLSFKNLETSHENFLFNQRAVVAVLSFDPCLCSWSLFFS